MRLIVGEYWFMGYFPARRLSCASMHPMGTTAKYGGSAEIAGENFGPVILTIKKPAFGRFCGIEKIYSSIKLRK